MKIDEDRKPIWKRPDNWKVQPGNGTCSLPGGGDQREVSKILRHLDSENRYILRNRQISLNCQTKPSRSYPTVAAPTFATALSFESQSYFGGFGQAVEFAISLEIVSNVYAT